MEALANIVHELWQAQNWKTISKKRHQEKSHQSLIFTY